MGVKVVGGGVVVFDILKLTTAEVRRFPAASRAIAAIVWLPFVRPVVFIEALNGAAVSSAPYACPSIKNWTPATPTLSDANVIIVIVPETV
jgi:hypothetical protein